MPYQNKFTQITQKGIQGQLFKALETTAQLEWVNAIAFMNNESNQKKET